MGVDQRYVCHRVNMTALRGHGCRISRSRQRQGLFARGRYRTSNGEPVVGQIVGQMRSKSSGYGEANTARV